MPTLDLALPDLDVIAIEWPDEDTPCSNASCDRAAVWWWECPGCGYTGFVCQRHREAQDRWELWIRGHSKFKGVKCNRCRHSVPIPLQWHPLTG